MSNKSKSILSSESDILLQNVEKIAVLLSFGGTVAGFVLEKYFMAFVPVCCALGLNFVNRQKMIKLFQQKSKLQMQSFNHDYEAQVSRTKDLENKQARDLIKMQSSQVDLRSQLIKAEGHIKKIELELIETNQVSKQLDDSISELNRQQEDIDAIVKELRVLGNSDEKDSNDESPANFYCKRGLIYHERQKYQQALKDFNQAILLDDQFAPVYHYSGLTHLTLGNKHQAFENLRKASQLYFADNNLDKYHQVRKLSQKLYHVDDSEGESLEETMILNNSQDSNIAVDDLFA